MTIKKTIIFILILLFFINFRVFAQKETNSQDKINFPIELEKQAKEALKTGKILLNFENIDIKILAKLMAELTDKNIILDDRVSGKITILSSHEITKREAWKIFVSALEAKGYSVIDLKKYVKIVPGDIKKLKIKGESDIRHFEDLVVAVIILKNIDPETIQNNLRPLLSPNGVIFANQASNSLIIADNDVVIDQIAKLVKHLDNAPKKLSLKIYPLKYANSSILAQNLQKIYEEKDKSNLKIISYDPGNSLIVYGGLNQINQIENIIKNLDKKREGKERKIQVLYLENGDAVEIAKTISTMLSEKQKVEQLESQTSSSGEKTTSYLKKEEIFATNVGADKSTNSLIFYATNQEFELLKKIVEQLDIPREQILVSAVIVEVSLKKMLDAGIKWNVIKNKIASSFQGGLTQEQLYGILASGNFILGASGQNTASVNTQNGGSLTFPNIFVLLSLLQTDSDFNILSAPRIVTTDHKEAKMSVGNVVPYATGVKFDQLNNPIISYDYKDVGLDLKITPHISKSKLIRMDISQKLQEITEFLQPTTGKFNYVVPVTSMRQFDTTVTVNEGQTIIVGGLVSKKTIDSLKKLPILGDIPILGHLFRQRNKQDEKITLFAFITPHIITSPEKIQEITKQYQDLLNEKLPPSKDNILDLSNPKNIEDDGKNKK